VPSFSLYLSEQLYPTPEAIIDDFYALRVDLYAKRKAHMLARLAAATEKLANRARFVLAVVRGDLIVSNRRKAELLAELHDAGYRAFAAGDDESASPDSVMDEEEIEEAAAGGVGATGASLGTASLAKRCE
jgi:DNA topoisomerase II